MSMFAKIFGSKQNSGKAPSPQEAIQKLLEIEDLLRKRQEVLEKKIEDELKTAKANGVKNKRIALQALKRKKRYEQQLNQIDGTLTTLEYQRESLENANTNTEVLKTMGIAAKAFKSAHLELDVDKVQDLKDDIAEQQEIANEISNVISSPIGLDAQIDDDELLQELEELEQETLDDQLLNIPPAATDTLPSVPVSEPSFSASTGKQTSSKISAEEAELNELMNWAS
ncbi:charged multivesicular body 4b [Brachionus plicatilis]|uniref:Charged multivesicular body 4b n=1 Tax=Brachionus plicatilis TaxID=10195 RepID=A0A3M7PGI7_BRAPC|nr:charged multivesicular body 4b [Brachionus plicatilis]